MGVLDKFKKILELDDEKDFEDIDDWYEDFRISSNPKYRLENDNQKDKTGISIKTQGKIVMNEDLSVKECVEILEYTTNKLKKSLGLNELENNICKEYSNGNKEKNEIL